MNIQKPSFSQSSHIQKNIGTSENMDKSEYVIKDSILPSNQEETIDNKEKISAQIDSMNKMFELNMTSLKFNLHEDTDRYYVEVRNQDTQEVIKEIPSKEFLDLMARIAEFSGFLVDKRV
ncbi:flagellar protein FlaG [Cytobacillus spongiae]|uniref:flagellar protein FlaG n=1 Tax=Cytobacillus spongiae TaxID=2901381 RepID=UPI001F165076|nr:flagellar protein FlaG [Cytobacillus spongiae]UII55609.1 flagellar protein FlaG [Cytobacillus spongiae]